MCVGSTRTMDLGLRNWAFINSNKRLFFSFTLLMNKFGEKIWLNMEIVKETILKPCSIMKNIQIRFAQHMYKMVANSKIFP